MKYFFLNCTFALGFKEYFSEDSEPTDELGDKPGPEDDAATPLTESDPDDAPTPCEFIYSVPSLALPYAKPPGDPIFSWDLVNIWDDGA